MDDVGNVVIAICGLGVVCLGSVGLGLFLLVRVTGRAMLMPIMSSLGGLLFGGRGEEVPPEYDEVLQKRPTPRDLHAKIESANQDFDERFQQTEGARYDAQDAQPDDVDSFGPASVSDRGKGQFGARFSDRDPGRVMRDKRYERNRGPSRIPDDLQEGMFDEEGDIRKSDNPFDQVDPPSLRSDKSKRRRRRGRPTDDDEIFGGMLDDDGDGYADF